MALFSRRELFNGQALVASAAKIPNTQDAKGKRVELWQARAWEHYSGVPEIWFAMNYLGNALRRVRLYPATQPDPQEPPQPVEDGLALVELDRLRGVDGTHGQILRDGALQMSIPGEGYLALFPTRSLDKDAPPDAETAGIFSMSELEQRDDVWYYKTGEFSGSGVPLDKADTMVRRIWRSHPQFKYQPDSSMRALGALLDELLILDQQYRTISKSRIPSGLLLWPDEVVIRPTTPNAKPKYGDWLLDAIIDGITAPISDEDSAANVAPPTIKMNGDRIEQVRHLAFGREFDAAAAARYDKVLERVATGLDLPKAIILGIEDLNHWSSWLVDEDAFDSHLAPLVELLCSELTDVFLRPALRAGGESADEVFVWYDPSALIAHPNKADAALEANKAGIIGNEATRRYLGYSEDDAPSPEEAAERQAREELERQRLQGQPRQGPPDEDGTPVTASAAGDSLGAELAAIDQELLLSLQAACEGVVQRALAKAGGRLRARMPEGGPLASRVAGVDDRLVTATLGRDVVRALATDDELTEDSTAPVIAVFHRYVGRAQRKVRGILRRQGATAERLDQLEDAQGEGRDRAASTLTESLRGIVAALLFGAVPGRERGEASDFTVPAGVIREALAQAGGGTPAAKSPVSERPQGGVATGDDAMAVFAELGRTPDAWEWMTGDPTVPFEPHQDLEGVRFLDYQDDQLSVTDEGAWLNVTHYFPGDHLGCRCWPAPVFGDA